MLAQVVGRYGQTLKTGVRRRFLLRRMRSVRLKLSSRRSPFDKPIVSLLFLCYGNIYRSPLAEQLARRRLSGLRCESAGFHSKPGRPCPAEAIRAAHEIGVDLSACRSQCVSRAQIDRADLILVMDLGNCEQLARQFPDALPRTTLLGLFSPKPGAIIQDPYGLDDEGTRRIFAQIAESCDGLSRCLETAEPGEA
jgi:protein-tyrosine-phosphatase